MLLGEEMIGAAVAVYIRHSNNDIERFLIDLSINRVVQVFEAFFSSGIAANRDLGNQVRALVDDFYLNAFRLFRVILSQNRHLVVQVGNNDDDSDADTDYRRDLDLFAKHSDSWVKNIMDTIASGFVAPSSVEPFSSSIAFPDGILKSLIVSVSALPTFRHSNECVRESLMSSLSAFIDNDTMTKRTISLLGNILHSFNAESDMRIDGFPTSRHLAEQLGDDYWTGIITLAHQFRTRLGLNIFRNNPCLLGTLEEESTNDPYWESILNEGTIFAYIHIIESQGHLKRNQFENVMKEISSRRDGRDGRLPLENLEEALKKSARAIVRYWRNEDIIHGYEYPLTQVWLKFNGSSDSERAVVRFSRTKYPDLSQSRYIRSNSGKLRFVGRKGMLTIPEEIVLGSILPFLEQELSPEWALVREAFEAHNIFFRSAVSLEEIHHELYSIHQIGSRALMASSTGIDDAERDAFILAAMSLLQTVREWDEIDGGLSHIDLSAIQMFRRRLAAFLQQRTWSRYEVPNPANLDSFLQELLDIRSAVRRRVEYHRT